MEFLKLNEKEQAILAMFAPTKIGIDPSNPIAEFDSLTEDFINAGYFTEEAETMAANVIEAQ